MYLYVHQNQVITPNKETNIMGIHIHLPSAKQMPTSRKTEKPRANSKDQPLMVPM